MSSIYAGAVRNATVTVF